MLCSRSRQFLDVGVPVQAG